MDEPEKYETIGHADQSRDSISAMKMNDTLGSISIGQQDEGMEEEKKTETKEEEEVDEDVSTPKAKRGKKRRLVLDDKTEIAGSVIREQLENTSAIVRQRIPPSQRRRISPEVQKTPAQLLAEPAFDGLAAELKKVFQWTMRPTSDLPINLPLQIEENEEESEVDKKDTTVQQDQLHEESKPEEVEEPRIEGKKEDTTDFSITVEHFDNDPNITIEMQDFGPEFDAGNDAFVNLDEEAKHEADIEDILDDGLEPLELGAVNDLQQVDVGGAETIGGDDSGEPGQNWHPHTVKVFKLLHQQFQKKDVVSYKTIAKGTKRRTAAGCFFELLQLKTWDYIELQQSESFGDIKITAAKRFSEVEAV